MLSEQVSEIIVQTKCGCRCGEIHAEAWVIGEREILYAAHTPFAVANETKMEHRRPLFRRMEGDARFNACLSCRLQISSIGDESIMVILVSPTDKVEGSVKEEIELLNVAHIVTHIGHDIEAIDDILIRLAF